MYANELKSFLHGLRATVAYAVFLVCGTAGVFAHAQQIPHSESKSEYFILFDTSVSMANRPDNPAAASWEPKIVEVKKQFRKLIEMLPDGASIHLYAFDKRFVSGPSVEISGKSRAELLRFVDGLKADGTETRLWRSLDAVLQEAGAVAASQPGTIVRVIAYSDGEDNESPRQLARWRS